jgi:hypothetical protein
MRSPTSCWKRATCPERGGRDGRPCTFGPVTFGVGDKPGVYPPRETVLWYPTALARSTATLPPPRPHGHVCVAASPCFPVGTIEQR